MNQTSLLGSEGKHSIEKKKQSMLAEKLYHCSKCEYNSRWKSALRKHVLVHSGEKPFQCSQCDFRCKYKSNLKSHLLAHSVKSTRDAKLRMVKEHQDQRLSQETSITKMAQKFASEHLIPLTEQQENEEHPATKTARRVREKFTKGEQDTREDKWNEHERAKWYYQLLNQPYINKEHSLYWLKKGRLDPSAERIIIAGQDNSLMTNVFKKMARINNNSQCRFCHQKEETVSHIMSGCETLMADGWYTRRHNKICQYLHWNICKDYNINVTDKSWEHQPEGIAGNNNVLIYYDTNIPTSRFIQGAAIRPDIVIWDRQCNVVLKKIFFFPFIYLFHIL